MPPIRPLLFALDRSWLLIILASFASYTLSQSNNVSPAIGVATVLLAYVKGRIVILDFMELRYAPWPWKAFVEAWLLAISIAITLGHRSW